MGDTKEPNDSGLTGRQNKQDTQFVFVLQEGQKNVRSEAMRGYWRRRHKQNEIKRQAQRTHQQELLPNPELSRGNTPESSSLSASPDIPVGGWHTSQFHPYTFQQAQQGPAAVPAPATSQLPGPIWNGAEERRGVPGQALMGLNHALACSRLDPFDMFPITLTAQHHKLLHHCWSLL